MKENTVWILLQEIATKKRITEIIINSPDNIYLEREGELIRINSRVRPEDLTEFCQQVAEINKVEFSPSYPLLDGTLPDGSRINIVSSLYTGKFPAITIRKYLNEISTFDDLNGRFNITDKWIELLKVLVRAKTNILVAGGTGVGKTTFLNMLLQEIVPTQRVVTIEDTRELSFNLPNTVRLTSANRSSKVKNPLKMTDLVRNALRMRPDRIIIGEVRGPEAFDLLQAMNTGHDGSMCTVHANSSSEALMRIENLYMLAGHDIPLKAIRYQMKTAIDYIIHLERDRDLGRVVGSISEVTGMEGDKILLQKLGERGDFGLEFTGLVPDEVQRLIDAGLPRDYFNDI